MAEEGRRRFGEKRKGGDDLEKVITVVPAIKNAHPPKLQAQLEGVDQIGLFLIVKIQNKLIPNSQSIPFLTIVTGG